MIITVHKPETGIKCQIYHLTVKSQPFLPYHTQLPLYLFLFWFLLLTQKFSFSFPFYFCPLQNPLPPFSVLIFPSSLSNLWKTHLREKKPSLHSWHLLNFLRVCGCSVLFSSYFLFVRKLSYCIKENSLFFPFQFPNLFFCFLVIIFTLSFLFLFFYVNFVNWLLEVTSYLGIKCYI